MSRRGWGLMCAVVAVVLFSSLGFAVTPDRIAGAVDPSNVVELKGHVSPWAQPQFDQGPVDPSRTMRLTMLFTPSVRQQQALEKLLAEQQDNTSPHFHNWLTSDQFGEQFGLSQSDLGKIKAWLQARGFRITYVAHGREFLSFEGNAGQVQSVFKTEVHKYNVNGKMHFANVTPPQIPAALGGIVGGFRGLHDFFPRPHIRPRPAFTVSGQNTHFLSPGDIATIYDINPLYKAAVPIDGTGQKVVIVGQSDVYLADLNYFRSAFGLSSINGCTTNSSGVITACNTSNFQMVIPGTGSDPGLSPGNLGESDLDIETISGVAHGAQIIFVTSSNGVDDSASWAIDQNPPLAPVISYSYGLCEAFVTAPSIAAAETVYKQASAEGISFFASSGDAAAATCDGDNGTYPAQLGPSVSYPASSPEVTGVGGTEFNEGSNSSTYWGTSNGADGASVLPNGPQNGYIPELAWNDSTLAAALDGTGGGPSNCAFGTGTTTVGGFAFEVCSAPPNGGFPKPSWQSSLTPNDSVRDVPDVSFSASNVNDLYIVCAPQSEVVSGSTSPTSTCAVSVTDAINSYGSAFGGTSGSAPVAAGVTVLLNQFLGANGLGNINSQLYTLYGTNPTVFHDITTASSSITTGTSDNIVPCSGATPSFEPSALQCPAPVNTAGTFGYPVLGGHKYSLATGLGSVDVNALFNAWSGPRTPSTVSISASTAQINVGQSVTFTATVSPTTAVGSVSFSTVVNNSTTVLGTAPVNLPYPPTTTGTAVFTTTALPGGSNSITASYLGDGSNTQSNSVPTVVTVIAPDFTVSAPASGSVVAGHTSSAVTVTITPLNGYAQLTSLGCTGLPTGATCAFNPPSVTPNGTTPITSSMTISTNASMAATTAPATVTINGNGAGLMRNSTYALTVTATDQTYTLTPGATSYQVTQGGSVSGASAMITLNGMNGFSTTNSPVSYTCSDPASESTCTVTTTSTGASFVITTQAPSAARLQPAGRSMRIFYAAMMPGLLGILFLAGSRKRSLRGLRLLGLILALGVSTAWMASCSNSNGGTKNPGTPTGSYTITVNATTGGTNPLTAQTTFTMQVNP